MKNCFQIIYIRELSTIMAGESGLKWGEVQNILENSGGPKLFWRLCIFFFLYSTSKMHVDIMAWPHNAAKKKFSCIWGGREIFYPFKGGNEIFYHHETFHPPPIVDNSLTYVISVPKWDSQVGFFQRWYWHMHCVIFYTKIFSACIQ